MHDIARAAIEQMPPLCRVTSVHAATIHAHCDQLLALGPGLAQDLSHLLLSHPATAELLQGHEQDGHEQSLNTWWARTVSGQLDEDYWAWIALISLAHVAHRVSNGAMLAIIARIAGWLDAEVRQLDLPGDGQARVSEALRAVLAQTGVVVTFGYDRAVSAALFEVAGMPESLLGTVRDHEAAVAVAAGRRELGLD